MSNLGQRPGGYKAPPMNNQQMQQRAQQMIQEAMMSGNPQAYVKQLMEQNPEMAKQMQGLNPQQEVMKMAQQRGFNVQAMFPRK